MSPINWAKIIKLSDVVDAIDDQDERIAALEEYVLRNTARIDTLEAERIHELERATTERQTEIDQLRAELERQRWHHRTGRRP